MRRNFYKVITSGLLAMSLLAGCGAANDQAGNTQSAYEMLETDLAVGMVTDSGTIDDRAFNQYTWQAIEGSIAHSKYIKPSGQTDADYLESIGNLYDAGYSFIVAPGYKFERAIQEAQTKYTDAKFVILDGQPVDGEGNPDIAENTVAIYFAEQEAGFIAGVAAAKQLQTGEFGFIGGMKIPSVQRYCYGFQQGIRYANENLGTQISLKEENVVYQGSFTDKAGGQQVAAQMYDKGVKAIFTAAGGTGIGAITEAKARAMNGDTDCFVIGVDVDQYEDGVYDPDTNASVILTSAMKKIDQATVTILKDEVEGQFPGGEVITFTVANDGVGIPAENPNLDEPAAKAAADIANRIKSGEIVVAESNDGSLI